MASLGTRYQQSDTERAIERDALVLEYLPLVRMIARRIHDRCPPSVSLDDLISTGVVGLLEAINNFDPSLNVQLKTYAERRIRGAILDGMREMDWVPRETRRRSRAIEAAIHAARQRYGREPSEEEIALELHLSYDEYREWLNGIQAIELKPLEYVSPDGQECSLLCFVSDGEENWPSALLERSELERVLVQAIDRMPRMERTILHLYYYEELSLAEISRVIGLHLSRIAQLRVQAILRLRAHLQRVWPNEYRRTQ
jgi:RNA polymerase sigma factor FliA